jgi:hypothetical protein
MRPCVDDPGLGDLDAAPADIRRDEDLVEDRR